MVDYYLDIPDAEYPFEEWGLTVGGWVKSLKFPINLYFLFKCKKDLGRFIRRIRKEFPEMEVIV